MNIKTNISILALSIAAFQLNGQLFEANQAGNSFTFEAYSGSESVVDFYNYSSSEFGGSMPSLHEDALHTFLYEDSDGLSLVNIFDDGQDDGSWFFMLHYGDDGGSAAVDIEVSGDTVDFLLKDDPYQPSYSDGNSLGILHAWSFYNTDGHAVGYLEGDWSLDMYLDIISNVDSWYLLSGDGEEHALTTGSSRCQGAPVLSINPLGASVPEPSAFGLLGAMMLLGLILKRRFLS